MMMMMMMKEEKETKEWRVVHFQFEFFEVFTFIRDEKVFLVMGRIEFVCQNICLPDFFIVVKFENKGD